MSIPFSSEYTVKRYTSAISDGVVSQTLAETFTIQGTLTPLQEKELQVLPEGLRSGARFKLRTETEILSGLQGTTSTHRLVVDSEEYTITVFGRWNQSAFGRLKHHKYLCTSCNE